MKKIIAMLMATGIMTSMFAGNVWAAEEFPDEDVTIRFAVQTLDREKSTVYAALEQFQEDFPNVTIELEESPGNDQIQKINTDVMGNNTPDIFFFWRPEARWNVDKYIEKGAIADITEWVNSDEFFDGLFPEYCWRTATVDDKIWAVPLESFYVEFLVNKEVFDEYGIELPTDWDKLVSACQQLSENGIIPWAVDTKAGLDDSSRVFNAIMNRAVGNAKGLELLKGNESFQQEDVIRALGYFLDVVKNYAPEDAAVLDYNQAIEKYLNTGKAGMILGNATQIDMNLTEEIMEDLIAMEFPLTPEAVIDKPSTEQDLTQLVYFGVDGWNDENKQPYLKELAKRFTSREFAKIFREDERHLIPQLGVDIDPSKVSDMQRQAAEVAENCDGDKWLLSYAKSGPVDEFRTVINDAWGGKYDSAEELAKALDNALFGK